MNTDNWQPMGTAPKDGTKILVYGTSKEPATSDYTEPASIGIEKWETDRDMLDSDYSSGGWLGSGWYYGVY